MRNETHSAILTIKYQLLTMNKLFLFALTGAMAAGMLTGCKDKSSDNSSGMSQTEKEQVLQKAMTPYVQNTVIATYSRMADEGITLLGQCEQILAKVEAGEDYSELMEQAGASWRAMRKYWEQSEAFLYGPAASHNIDPHIDSWPLDFNAMNSLLNNAKQMADIEAEGGDYVGNKLGYALKGFHAAEYLLFESVMEDDRAIGTGRPHATNLSHAEAVYLVGIVEDLTQQAILLEDCWAGGVSEEKEALITDEEGESASYGENYGNFLIYTGHAGIYKTYQAAAEEVIAGCVDIAGEVANLKLGNPYLSNTPQQRDYIESPYSSTSTIDFVDNIISIRNAYQGAQTEDASISDFVKRMDADLDQRVKEAIAEAIEAIEAIENFESTAQNNPQVKNAIDKVRTVEKILDDSVMALLAD